MPKSLQYRAGSLIYFQGDPADRIFILQNGSVNLAWQDVETRQDIHEMVQPGEFFGVKSALGHYPREENAQVLRDTVVMAFTVSEFEALAMANTRIIMKMLKVFSNQLRRVHKQVANLMEKEEVSPEAGLFSLGQFYLKARRFSHAKYVLSRYLTYYPAGKFAREAAKDLGTAESSLARYGDAASPTGGQSAPLPHAAATAPSPQAQSETAKAYYDAVSFITQQKYQQAYMQLRKLVDSGGEMEYIAKGSFELGHCLFLLGKYDESIQQYTQTITRYPKHPDLAEALFFMGQSYEKRGRQDQASTFYKKILTINTDPEAGINIKARRALKALEA